MNNSAVVSRSVPTSKCQLRGVSVVLLFTFYEIY